MGRGREGWGKRLLVLNPTIDVWNSDKKLLCPLLPNSAKEMFWCSPISTYNPTNLEWVKHVESKVEDVDGGPGEEEDRGGQDQEDVCSLLPSYLPCSCQTCEAWAGGVWDCKTDSGVEDTDNDAGEDELDEDADEGVGKVTVVRLPFLSEQVALKTPKENIEVIPRNKKRPPAHLVFVELLVSWGETGGRRWKRRGWGWRGTPGMPVKITLLVRFIWSSFTYHSYWDLGREWPDYDGVPVYANQEDGEGREEDTHCLKETLQFTNNFLKLKL